MTALPALPAAATEPQFRMFHDYWCACAPAGALPGRQHIDPVIGIPQLTPNLMLYDVVEAGGVLRFRVRVAGQAIVEIIGHSPAGHFIDEIVLDEHKAAVNAAFATVVRDGIAHFWENQLWTAGREYIRMQRLALPLARDGRHPDMVIALQVRVNAPDGPQGRRPSFGFRT